MKQFFKGFVSRPSEEDKAFVRKYLSIEEAALFDNLSSDEQKHSITVAREMVEAAKGSKELDKNEIAEFALLHDIGKATIKLSLIDRAVLVILRRVTPRIYNGLAEKGESSGPGIFKKFYVHKFHGKIGAELLRRAEVSDKIANLVEVHDKKPEPDDPIELMLLRQLDDKN